MNISSWGVADWVVVATPILFTLIALRIGVPQMREFHRHTGETGLLISMFALSRFAGEESEPCLPLAPKKKHRRP